MKNKLVNEYIKETICETKGRKKSCNKKEEIFAFFLFLFIFLKRHKKVLNLPNFNYEKSQFNDKWEKG